MKVVNHKTLTSALFALLMFSVAVSGGCGGGGSGNTVGSTKNLVDGFTNEYASPDLQMSAPEELSSDDVFVSGDSNGDDEFGAGEGEVDQFTLLSKTTWNIESVTVNANNGRTTCEIQGDNSKGTKTVTFFTWGSGKGGTMAWAYADPDPYDYEETKKRPIGNEDLTIDFKGTEFFRKVHTAPMVRPGNFTATNDYTFQASVGAGTETIILSPLKPGAKTPDSMTVKNEFSVNGTPYTCTVELSRLNHFLILDQTDWKVKDVQIFKLVPDASGNYTYGDPNNNVITESSDMDAKILLRPRSKLGNLENLFKYTVDNRYEDSMLTVKFKDKTLNLNKEFYAPFLRWGAGFFANGTQSGYTLYKGILKGSDIPGDEVLQVSDYGPNANIVIDNSFCYRDKNNPKDEHHYWTRLILEPTYIPPKR